MTSPLVPSALIRQLHTLPSFLLSNIIGQDEVLHDICGLLRRSFCELRFPQRPIASMLYLGPTGVGKTETALLFTEHLYGDKNKLQRLDMSEYMVEDSIKVLRGEAFTNAEFSACCTTAQADPARYCLMRSRKRTKRFSTCFSRSYLPAGSHWPTVKRLTCATT